MDTVEEKYLKFLVNEPESQIEWRTLEIYTDVDDSLFRFVASKTSKEFTLESSAPRNPSETVEFSPATMEITQPSERQDGEQILQVVFGDSDGVIQNLIEDIVTNGQFSEVQIVYRKYYSEDVSEPASPPLYLYASSVSFEGYAQGSLTAEDALLNSRKVGTYYTTDLFPGLLRD